MNEIEKDKALTTADVAAAAQGAPAEKARTPQPPGRREYVGEPKREAGFAGSVSAKPSKTPGPVAAEDSPPLFSAEESRRFQSDWDSIQIGFVDEPRKAVERADGLVAQVIKRLAEVFAEERGKVEGQWSRGADVSTEDLRLALQRYRSFFARLLSF